LFDQNTYCPYTGLRSFTEEEAIYFKGRDTHIEEATKQLEDRKFLMLTGSSGDGKSSLVYAGIVPHARAGFLKAHYSNWIIADFKPERSPFNNLCAILADQLGIHNVATVKSELSYGYSSLVELYKNSSHYIDKSSDEWNLSSEEEKRNLRRKSANLLILADQFEEFFTNPENYFQGVTSQESNLVINLLLETARIAKEEDLPIYVVCTMRSDYIGQCASFRGLPEFIGYSQFFVPRLNRKQLLEVIEEPALLSGNKISKRLSERLIHDITEGVDQLPILQHALNQIWRAADNGNQEMDLIHYAMVGGIAGEELPNKDQIEFTKWFGKLPQNIQDCYELPNLQNVLNTHANKLFATAAHHYNSNNEEIISEQDASHLIHNVFVCLTKIDHARAVRNRMTLQEITDITDIEGLNTEKVRKLTSIFRTPNNTLIQPFIDEEGNDPLGKEDLLDISHESLIRNWTSLKKWAQEEFNHVNTYRDYKQQVDRWNKNGQSSDYLLPIGTLTHFEDWFHKTEPNKYWIQRYNQEIEDKEMRLDASEKILKDSIKYLDASNKKHLITRTVMKLGGRRIAAAFAILSILIFSSFYIYEEYSKSDDIVYSKIQEQGIEFLKSDDIGYWAKKEFIVQMVRKDSANFDLIFSDLEPNQSFDISFNIIIDFLKSNQRHHHPLLDKMVLHSEKQLVKLYDNAIDSSTVDKALRDYSVFINALRFGQYFQPGYKWDSLISRNNNILRNFVIEILDESSELTPEAVNINFALEVLLNNNGWKGSDLSSVLRQISPLEENFSNRFPELYQKDNLIKVGPYESSFNYNGLYQELAYIYASQGNLDKTISCIDTLLKYNENYYQNNYNLIIDNATNIAFYFLKNNHEAEFDLFVKSYCQKAGISIVDFMDKLTGKSIISSANDEQLDINVITYLHNNNTGLMDAPIREKIFDSFENTLSNLQNPEEKNFRLALFYKQKALFTAQHQVLLSGSYTMNSLSPIYDKAMKHYNLVSESYLQAGADRMYWGARVRKSPRKSQFIFPGYLENQSIWIQALFTFHYLNTSFIQYLTDNNYVNDLYTSQEDIQLITEWASYMIGSVSRHMWDIFEAEINYSQIASFLMEIKSNPAYTPEMLSSLKVLVTIKLSAQGNEELAKSIADEIVLDNIESSLPDINRGYKDAKYNNLGLLGYFFIKNGEYDRFDQLINGFELPTHKATLAGFVASKFGYIRDYDKCRELLKRAEKEDAKKLDGNGMAQEMMCYSLSLLPDLEGYERSREIWKNSRWKGFIESNLAKNFSYTGYAWRAYENIDDMSPPRDKLWTLNSIIQGLRLNTPEEDSVWTEYDKINDPFTSFMWYTIN
jgi:energy-coupling factor transporter ATP-binding protein EcfA2